MEVAPTQSESALIGGIRGVVSFTGRAVSWLSLLLVMVIFAIVVLRYGFNLVWVSVQESVIYLHAMIFLLAAGWTLSQDGHVRVDIIYGARSERYRAWINLLGCCLFLFPMCIFTFLVAWDYVASSFAVAESSREAGGLPGVYLLKSLILFAPALLFLQGIVLVCDSWSCLRREAGSELV
jgi:TRAP-type mannitol/chloroaromatic compound transport system permease small subunit